MIKRIQKYLDHLIRGDEHSRVHTKIKLVRNYMLLEQLKVPHELLIDVYVNKCNNMSNNGGLVFEEEAKHNGTSYVED